MDDTVEGDIVQVVGDEVIYRASSLGSCIKALAAARQELEPWRGPLPEKIQAVFDRGHEAEDEAVEILGRVGRVSNRQRTVVVALSRRLKIVGHIDFLYEEGDWYGIVDAKRQNDEEWAKDSIRDSLFWHKYEWQFSSYIEALGLPMRVARINDAGDIKLEDVAPSYSRSDLLRRVLAVEALAATDLGRDQCEREDYPCPYFHLLHPEKQKIEYEDVEDTELADMALHYKRLGVELKPLQERHKKLRDGLISRVKEKALGGALGGAKGAALRETVSGIKVRVNIVNIRERVIPAGTQTRLTVDLPSEESASEEEGE